MLQIKLVHLKSIKSFKLLINNVAVLNSNYTAKYVDLKKTSRLRFVFPIISVFSRCGWISPLKKY